MVSGDTMVSMISHEMNEEEKKTDELVDKIIQKMQLLKVVCLYNILAYICS